jgi:energy-coupling factor transporter ATP-binding protein EcfA2
MEEEKKGSELNIKGGPQESGEKAQNVLLIGTSGSGKSSLINYLAGHDLADVGDSGSSCTKDNMFYEVTFINKKLRIFDTQGFNDTATSFTKDNGDVASRIKF